MSAALVCELHSRPVAGVRRWSADGGYAAFAAVRLLSLTGSYRPKQTHRNGWFWEVRRARLQADAEVRLRCPTGSAYERAPQACRWTRSGSTGHREPQEEMSARYGQRQAETVSGLLGCQAKRTADGNEMTPPLVVWGGDP